MINLQKIFHNKSIKAVFYLAFGFLIIFCSLALTVQADATNVTLNIIPNNVNSGGNIRIQWTVTGEPTSSDWIAIFPHNGAYNEYISWFYTEGEVNGEHETTAPLIPGVYDVRYFSNNTYTQIGQTQTFTVDSSIGVRLTVSPQSVTIGMPVTVSYLVQSPSFSDWIGLYKPGASNHDFIDWQNTNGETEGSLIFHAPLQPGTYEFRYLINNSYIQIGNSVSFGVSNPNSVSFGVSDPGNLPALVVSPNPVSAGGQFSVGWSGAPGGDLDWVGIFAVGAPNSHYVSWQYTNGGSTGSLNFIAPITPGHYEARYFVNNSYIQIGQTATFDVVPGVQSLEMSVVPSPVSPGGNFQVYWAISSATPSDWIGVYKVNAINTDYLNWTYTDGNLSGHVDFSAPFLPGSYEVRYFINNSYNQIGNSAPFEVSGSPGLVVLTVSPQIVGPGDEVTVHWNVFGHTSFLDWIGMYEQGASNTEYLAWNYTEGEEVGELVFIAPNEPGSYEFRYFSDNSYNQLGNSITFQVQ